MESFIFGQPSYQLLIGSDCKPIGPGGHEPTAPNARELLAATLHCCRRHQRVRCRLAPSSRWAYVKNSGDIVIEITNQFVGGLDREQSEPVQRSWKVRRYVVEQSNRRRTTEGRERASSAPGNASLVGAVATPSSIGRPSWKVQSIGDNTIRPNRLCCSRRSRHPTRPE